ncbi:hypothetical protein BGY98DRAFT_496542 [Russula aff. rugulosa BPL654]|nr:hypothetical protein BGY98DRAFT_496542 [Russula aff. rugulosa BPL654]
MMVRPVLGRSNRQSGLGIGLGRAWSAIGFTPARNGTRPRGLMEGDDHAVIKDSPERYARIIGSGGQVKPKSAFLSSVLRLRNYFGNDKSCGNESRIHSGIRPSPYSSISHLFDSIAKPQWSRFLLGQGGCSNSRFLLATWPKKGSDQLVQARSAIPKRVW